jgi:hypothetical protein
MRWLAIRQGAVGPEGVHRIGVEELTPDQSCIPAGEVLGGRDNAAGSVEEVEADAGFSGTEVSGAALVGRGSICLRGEAAAGGRHAERCEDIAGEEVGVGDSGEARDDIRENRVIGVAVLPLFAGGEVGLVGLEDGDKFFGRDSAGGRPVVLARVGEIVQAGVLIEKHAESALVGVGHAGQVFRELVIE